MIFTMFRKCKKNIFLAIEKENVINIRVKNYNLDYYGVK